MSARTCAAVLVIVLAASRAYAGDADCSYFEVTATSAKDATIDPELRPLEKKLKKPPFASWNAFHKMSGGAFALTKLKAESLHLARGAASVLLRDRHDTRIELTLTVDGPDGKRVADTKPSVTAGDWLVLGTNTKDDGHILAITCK